MNEVTLKNFLDKDLEQLRDKIKYEMDKCENEGQLASTLLFNAGYIDWKETRESKTITATEVNERK